MIIAVDFDGVLCEDAFPSIGKPIYEMISMVRQLIDLGHEVILWTMRNGEELTKAVDWCGDYGLHFCNVNGPAPTNEMEYRDRYEKESRKIYADIYIDDHNLDFDKMEMITSVRKGVRNWSVQKKIKEES